MGTTAYSEEQGRRGPLRLAPLALLSDEALAGRVRAGDERAFEALYGRYRDRLYRYCASILRQPEDAEEALQSTMLGAYRSLVQSDERELVVRAWLYRIAHNQCIDLLRRRPAHAVTALSGLESSPDQGPAERLETADELARVREDLLSLPAGQRAALVLRELSGLSHEQIADVLDESAAGVKQIIYQARLTLTDMAEGRRMDCHEIRRRISDGDGRVLRSRSVGAHLRSCAGCTAFRTNTVARPGQLAAIAPALPLVAAERVLEAIRSAAGGLGGGGGAAAASAGAVSSGALSGFGGGLGAKLALVATASVVGGSIAAVPVVIGNARRPPERQPAAATIEGYPGAAAAAGAPTGASVPAAMRLTVGRDPSASIRPATTRAVLTASDRTPAAGASLGGVAQSPAAPGTFRAPGLVQVGGPTTVPAQITVSLPSVGRPSGSRTAVGPAGAPPPAQATTGAPPLVAPTRPTEPVMPTTPAPELPSPPVPAPAPPTEPGAAAQSAAPKPSAPDEAIASAATPDPPAPARGSAP